MSVRPTKLDISIIALMFPLSVGASATFVPIGHI